MEPSSLLELSSTINLNGFARANVLHPILAVILLCTAIGAGVLVGAAKAYWGKYFFERLRSPAD